MRLHEFLGEGRDAPLYHATKVAAALAILRRGRIAANTEQYDPPKSERLVKGVSLTRDRRVAQAHGAVVFKLDQGRLARRQRIIPINYWASFPGAELAVNPDGSPKVRQAREQFTEAEEFVIGPVVLAEVLTAILFNDYAVRAEADRDRIADAELVLLRAHPLARPTSGFR